MQNDIIANGKKKKQEQTLDTITTSIPIKRDSSNHRNIRLHLLSRLAFKNLTHKKLRTFLTISGVVIGVGAVVFLVSFASGLQNLVSKQVLGSRSVNSITVTSPHSDTVKLNPTRYSTIKNVDGVTSVGKLYNAAGKTSYNNSYIDTVVYGTDEDYLSLTSLQYVAGEKIDATANEDVVINVALQKALGASDAKAVLGKTIAVSFNATKSTTGETKEVKQKLVVKGVVNDGTASEVFLSSNIFESAGAVDATQFNVEVVDKSKITKIRQHVESLGLSTTSPLDTIAQINQVFSAIRYIVLGFGGIGMLTAVFGMFNTLTISLLERTREIGLMVSLGARRRDIKRLFLLESVIVSFTGGLVGIVTAGLLGVIINVLIGQMARGRGISGSINIFLISPSTTAITLFFSFILGLVVAYFPVRRAAKTNPIDALRYE